ncbi:hypothetical protein KUL42_32060 [Alteromonas sp. KUL42]|nr:hypothetical protein KUL42_32060 [Alteromonas sp. KUL42]
MNMNTAKTILISMSFFYSMIFSNFAGSTPILLIDNDKLIGAIGVNIKGQLYDVEFIDTPCTQNYPSCSGAEFSFQTQSDALYAANELLAQVLVNTSSHLFDTNPHDIFGCDSTISCQVLIPFLVQSGLLNTAFANNLSGTSVDNTGLVRIRPTDSLQSINNRVFARFNLAQVSEPSVFGVVALIIMWFLIAKLLRRGFYNSQLMSWSLRDII